MMKYTPSALKMQGQRAAFSKSSLIFSIFTKSAEGDRCCFGVCRGVPNRTQVYIFKIFILTIAQASDGINCFLQLFLHKLRTCLFVRGTHFIFTSFCAVLTIRYFLTALYRSGSQKTAVSVGFCDRPPRTIVLYTSFVGFEPCFQWHPQRLHLQPLLPFPAFCRFSKTALHSFCRMR